MGNSFGDFIETKRKALKMTLRSFANNLGVSAAYICDIEKGNRLPTDNQELLKKIVEVLGLDENEKVQFFDFAAEQKEGSTPLDISAYLKDSATARTALRTAKQFNATENDWKKFMDMLKEKNP